MFGEPEARDTIAALEAAGVIVADHPRTEALRVAEAPVAVVAYLAPRG